MPLKRKEAMGYPKGYIAAKGLMERNRHKLLGRFIYPNTLIIEFCKFMRPCIIKLVAYGELPVGKKEAFRTNLEGEEEGKQRKMRRIEHAHAAVLADAAREQYKKLAREVKWMYG